VSIVIFCLLLLPWLFWIGSIVHSYIHPIENWTPKTKRARHYRSFMWGFTHVFGPRAPWLDSMDAFYEDLERCERAKKR
jgi:hypothetical protein